MRQFVPDWSAKTKGASTEQATAASQGLFRSNEHFVIVALQQKTCLFCATTATTIVLFRLQTAGMRHAYSQPTIYTLSHSNDDDLSDLAAMTIADDTCPYCHQTYRQPRLLHCLHAICEDCIVAQLERRPDESQMRRRGMKLFIRDLVVIKYIAIPGRYAPPRPQLIEQELEPGKGTSKPPPGVIRCPVCHQDSQVRENTFLINDRAHCVDWQRCSLHFQSTG